MSTVSVVEVVGGAIIKDGLLLCLRKGPNAKPHMRGLYEFPGGKIEAGETPAEALKRELQEELRLTVTVEKEIGVTETAIPDGRTVRLHILACTPISEFILTEHDDARWLTPQQALALPWADADTPILPLLV